MAPAPAYRHLPLHSDIASPHPSAKLAGVARPEAGRPAGSPATRAVLKGVLLTPEFSAVTPSGQIQDSPYFIESFWFRCVLGTTKVAPDAIQGCTSIPAGNYLDSAGDAEHQPGLNVALNDSLFGPGLMRFNVGGPTGGANQSALAAYTPVIGLSTGWHNLLLFGDATCRTARAICGGVLLDGVQIVSGFTVQGAWSAHQTVGFGTNPFYLNVTNGTSAAHKLELAQPYLDTTASPVVAGTNRPNFDTTKFYNRGPVDFGTNCATPLGHAPSAFCMSNGPGAFLINVSNAPGKATFTATGQFTNTVTNRAYAAAFSPGETPDRPFARWSYSATFNRQCAESTRTCSSSSQPLASGVGNAIPSGDLLCATITVSGNNSNFNDGFNPPTGGGVTTWTNVLGATAANNHLNNLAMFCGTVTAPTAAGSDMPTLTWTWANANGGGFSRAAITLTDFGKPGGTPSIVAATATDSSISATALPCPPVTAPSGLSLWVCLHTTFGWDLASPASRVGPAPSSTLLAKLPAGNPGDAPMIEYEKIDVSGAVTRTAQGNPGNRSLAAAMILQ